MASRIALGTVQFGLDYGINNDRGQPPYEEAARTLALAAERGVDLLDTAAAYGTSEAVIGRFLAEHPGAPFRLVTKLPADVTPDTAAAALGSSLERLGRDAVHGLLLHAFDAYRRHPELWERLEAERDAGRVARIGCSLYHPAELDALLEAEHVPDLIQFPHSALDRRFESRFDELRARGVELHARSCFLQGLFFRAPESLPAFFDDARPAIAALQAFAASHEVGLGALLLAWSLGRPGLDRVVIGVDRAEDLEDNLAAERLSRAILTEFDALVDTLPAPREDILLPYTWPKRD